MNSKKFILKIALVIILRRLDWGWGGGKVGEGTEGDLPPPIKRKNGLYPMSSTALPQKC